MRLVGEGDDQIRDWRSPIADYPNITALCDYCSEFDFEFPVTELQIELEKLGKPRQKVSARDMDDASSFLEALLSPYFHVSRSAWGGESPGRSGVFKRGYLELGHTKQLRKVLQITNEFIVQWSESSGLNAAIEVATAKRQIEKQLVEEEKVVATSDFQRDEVLQKEAWEDQLFYQILQATHTKSSRAFCRFNFLVHNRIVFYLDRAWWHSTKGSVSAVAERLERVENLTLVRCEVGKTRFGWIPHFGRTREEEITVGWREPGIEVTAANRWADRLSEAMRAEKNP
jgi:hypothetical protein